jgi:hypothetical protein
MIPQLLEKLPIMEISLSSLESLKVLRVVILQFLKLQQQLQLELQLLTVSEVQREIQVLLDPLVQFLDPLDPLDL